jgi:hypothetical protein
MCDREQNAFTRERERTSKVIDATEREIWREREGGERMDLQ